MEYLNFARKMVEDVRAGRIKSVYSHDNIMRINAARLEYQVDCSGFVRYILENAGLPEAVSEIVTYVTTQKTVREEFLRMYTYDVYDFFEGLEREMQASSYWESVKGPQDIKAGDIIVWLGAEPGRPDRYSGHVAIVDEVLERKGGDVKLRVIDATQERLSPETSAYPGSGIGKSVIRIRFGERPAAEIAFNREQKSEKKIRIARPGRRPPPEKGRTEKTAEAGSFSGIDLTRLF